MPGLPKGLTLYREPHWSRLSPDRRFFLSWAADVGHPLEKYDSPARYMIRLGRLDGGPTRVLAPDGDEEFAWSPDSRRLAYTVTSPRDFFRRRGGLNGRLTSTQVVLVGIDGSHEEVVLERPGHWSVCDWSPDGKRLLLVAQSSLSLKYGTADLIELDLAGAEAARKRVPPGEDYASSSLSDEHLQLLTGGQKARRFLEGRYSPDGKRIATILSRHLERPGGEFDPKGFELAVMEIASANLRVIARYPEGLRGPICWSPDGQEVLFSRYLEAGDKREKTSRGDPGLGIWAIRRDGAGARFLTTGWSPEWR